MNIPARVLGIDIGHVIFDQWDGVPIEGAVESITALIQSDKFSSARIVSKCYPNTQRKSQGWLQALDFWNKTGIPESHLHFCLKYWEKAPICEHHEVTDFIDDRPRVLNKLAAVPSMQTMIAFNPKMDDWSQYEADRPITICRNWRQVLDFYGL